MLPNAFSCFKETVRSQDKFGKPIQLTFHNKTQIKSFFGGFLSLCIKFGILSYLIVQLKQVWDLSEIKIIQSIFQRNLLIDDYEIKLNEKNFDVALYLTYAGQNHTIADEIDAYVTLQIFQVVSVSSKGEIFNSSAFSTATWDTTPVPLIRCPSERMGGASYSETMAGLYWCPKYVNFTVQGHYQTNNKDIEIRMTYCDQSVLDTYLPGKICKSKEETNQIIGAITVRVAMLTQFTDLRSFGDERIKKTLTVYDSGLNDIVGQAMYFKVSENTVKFKDSIISNTVSEEDFVYINVRLTQITTQSLQFMEGYIGSMLFFMDEDVKISQRTVQTIFDVFAQCGGLLGTLTVFCALIVQKYEEIVYQHHLIKSLYNIFDKETFLRIKNKYSNGSQDQNTLNKKLLILADIQSRIPLRIRLKEWFLLKSCFKTAQYKSAKLNQALQKLNKELDIVSIIRAKRDFKNLLKLTTSHQFKHLLRYSKESLIVTKQNTPIQKKVECIDSELDRIFQKQGKNQNKKIIDLLFSSVNRQSLVFLNENDDDVKNKQCNENEDYTRSQRKQFDQSSRLNLMDLESTSSKLINAKQRKQSNKNKNKRSLQQSINILDYSKNDVN